MLLVTDPAEEFAVLCKKLSMQTNKSGADFLANSFSVKPWSQEFYQILFTIIERGYYLKQLTAELPEAQHISPLVHQNIDTILRAFQANGLGSSWKDRGAPYLSNEHVGPIRILSAIVRQHVSYPLLGEEERSEILALVSELLTWLEDHQFADEDFIRQALIDGLKNFQFRFERVEWLGWGFGLESLREVIAAYMALERGFVDDGSNPLIEAAIQKTGAALKRVYQTVGFANEATERADFILKAYGAAAMVLHAKSAGLAGLLTFSSQ